jgi:hypothetical protein
MSIDKNDTGLQYESKYNSIKAFLISELNNLNEFSAENGCEYLYHIFQ